MNEQPFEHAGNRKPQELSVTTYNVVTSRGVNVFYREAGPKDAQAIVLLHGFPSSSHMFRDLITNLSDRFHLIAPDYPGFGNSDMPSPTAYAYTFDNLAATIQEFLKTLGLTRYSLYMQDYGAPVGFRLATRNPEQIDSLIIQNANAYTEGLSEALSPLGEYWKDRKGKEEAVRGFLKRDSTIFQYTHGARNPARISPDAYNSDQAFLDRPGNDAIQLELLFDYQHNVTLYPDWHAYLRTNQPPALIVWGKNDPFFTVAGAEAYRKDLKHPEIHFLEGGHFVLEEAHEEVARYIVRFFGNRHTAAA
jgi:pimeloyl-ACP methyl ester carboxylesterase